MKLYHWDSFERRFLSVPVRDHLPNGECVRLISVEIPKGERINAAAASDDQMICLLSGSWRINIANSELVVRRNEAVIIPSGFNHSAEAIEDSFALQMVREHGPEEECLWGV
ncbi:MAG: hypothetical protein DMF61_12395 [Blastocatellia bacterium AA13]|nr:MAG: hypothetical protein DMF61_12395 [Blastocatellia bacterium AA13]